MPPDHFGQPRGFIDDRIEALGAHFGIAVAPAPDQLRVGVDDGQRRLELVRCIGDELPFTRERILQPVDIASNVAAKRPDLIAAFPTQAPVEFFRADLFHRMRQPHDRIDRLRAMKSDAITTAMHATIAA